MNTHFRPLTVLITALGLTHCATPKEVALHTGLPMQASARTEEGLALAASVRSASLLRPLTLTPTASASLSTRALLTVAFGVDLRLQLDPERFGTPVPLIMSVGFDALNLGCQRLPHCYLGTSGMRGEVGAIAYRGAHGGAWSVSVGLDQDVRFGPRSNTSLIAGVRWTQGTPQNE